MLDASKIYRDLHGQLHVLDKDREKLYKKVEPFKYLFWSYMIIGGAAFVFHLNSGENEMTTFYTISYIGGTVLLLIIFLGVYFTNLKKFKEQFTGLIAPKIIKAFDPGFTYSYNGKIREDALKASKLFPSFNTYQCQDLVTGKIEGNPFHFAEIKLVKKNQGKDNNSSSTVFSGIFFQAELQVNFPTDIWIVPKHQWKALFGDSRERLKISHPALKPYRLYCIDTMTAKQVLQPYILEKVGEVNRKLKQAGIANRPLNYHFGDNKIQVALSTRYRFMEPSLNKSIESEAFIRKQTDLLNALSHLLKDLTLS